MRDLYKRLGISPRAAAGDLELAIRQAAPDLAEDARAALLDPQRRSIYDANHRVLSQIGLLRARLNLPNTQNWAGDAASDFSAPAPAQASVAPPSTPAPSPPRQTEGVASVLGSAFVNLLLFVLRNPRVTVLATVLVGYGLLILFAPRKEPSIAKPTVSEPVGTYVLAPEPVFAEPEVPLPPSGILTRSDRRKLVAPLKIASSGTENHYVKLVDTTTGKAALTIFVRGGTSPSVHVPLGSYELRYAAGERWYGDHFLFGPSTSFSKSDTVFTFEIDGNQIKGFTVTLFKVENGNMHTRSIGRSEF